MRTAYGNLPNDSMEKVEINTVGDLKKAIRDIPDGITVGFMSPMVVQVIHAPSAPCLIIVPEDCKLEKFW